MPALDFYEAAKYALQANDIFRAYFAEQENTTLENFNSLKGTQQYEVTECAIACGLIKKTDHIITGEEGFLPTTQDERDEVSESHLVGDGKSYIIPAGKSALNLLNFISNSLDAVEEQAALESWER